jgi:MerR family transcriptional regulator, copper efflux regulator
MGGGACAEVKADLRSRIAAQLAEAEQRAAELSAFTSSPHSALQHLDALPGRATQSDPECGFLSRPAPAAAADEADGMVLSPNRKAAGQEAERWRSARVACSLTAEA